MCLGIYEKSMAGVKVGVRDFVRFANFSRFQLALEDRNRRASYAFSNDDFSSRIPKWLPDQEKQENLVDRFEMLPETWNPNVPQHLGNDPTCWVIEVCGDTKGLKGGRPSHIILSRRTQELCLKYRDLKEEVLQSDQVVGHDNFFVNSKGTALAPIQRTAGSLLSKLGSVCGLDNATVKTFRHASESVVQASLHLNKKTENLQGHSN